MRHVGQPTARHEDQRLLRGQGRFVDDKDLPGQLSMAVVRSTIAHARISDVDIRFAQAHPKVHAVLTGADVADVPCIPVRLKWTEESLDQFLQPVLARDRVRYVGEPVAVVVADDPYAAEDAAELVDVSYEPLPAVTDASLAGASTSLWDGGQGNQVAKLELGFGDVDDAFSASTHVVDLELHIGRHSGVPLETRGILAAYDEASGGITVWGQTKVPHYNRRVLSEMLGIPVEKIHFLTTDAGGGFGVRGEFYPEDFLVPHLSMLLRRPVKWIEDRAEHLVSTNHSRQQEHHISVAFDDEGHILGLRDEIWHDNGAYLRTHGVTVPQVTITMLAGPYRIENYRTTVHVMSTNKTPAGTYRGPGRYEGTFVREQALNVAAERIGIDRVEIRRRNLLRQQDLPHRRPGFPAGKDMVLDQGDYAGLLERAIDASGFRSWEDEARRLRGEGRFVGTGLCIFLEKSGLGPYESADVEYCQSGKVRVLAGGASLGQGIETVLAQIAADELGVDPSDVEVVHGDTNLIPDGVGSWASRTTVVGGSAVHEAAAAVADRAKEIGASLLDVTKDRVYLEDRHIKVRGFADRQVSLDEVARVVDVQTPQSSAPEPGPLRASRTWFADTVNFPYGTHFAQVEIDPLTGGISILRYYVAYEVGRAINPMLVRGQLVGGVAQGLGGAFLEEFTYDDNGQPQATTFMDYLLPTAMEIPDVGTLICEDAPPTDNPLGAMGSGEGGTTGSGAAIASAVEDALGETGAVSRLPITPVRLMEILESREDRRTRA
jgi:aerobic carbon-monoxide dehydrogenase large subunit